MILKIRELVDGKLYKVISLAGERDDVYRQVYEMERSSRYDWRREYQFQSQGEKDEYQTWKKENETFSMFYGNATVD